MIPKIYTTASKIVSDKLCLFIAPILYHKLVSPKRRLMAFTVTRITKLMALLKSPTAEEKLYWAF
jgi:hypothetical protein